MKTKLIVYGHEFCADAIYLQAYLNRAGIAFEWRNIAEGDPHFKEEFRLLARGCLSVPTVIFPDGEVLVEPNPKAVLARLKS